MKLKEKVVIVTGGSGGIGKAVSAAFCRAGSTVVIIGRDEESIEKAILDIQGSVEKEAYGMMCDVSNFMAVSSAVKAIVKRFKKIDVLVNCAGVQAPIC